MRERSGLMQPAPLSSAADGNASPAAFLDQSGAMAARMRAHDWSSTPLGPPERWPQSLKTIVRMMLDSRYAMWMLWGPELTFFCNDAYLPTVGIKRDWVLGARSDLVWEEIWPDIGPRIQQVLTRGEATWDEALQLFLERSGFAEETYHTFSYSPVHDDASHIAGMLCVVTEVTERVIGERRLRILRDLATQSDTRRSAQEACERICSVLARCPMDVSFAGLYLLDGNRAALAAQTRELPGSVLAASYAIDAAVGPWPIAELVRTEQPQELSDLPGAGVHVTAEPWPEPVRRALLLPLKGSGPQSLTGFLILGASTRRALDEDYRAFLQLLAGQATATITDAQAYSAERARAEALTELDRAKTEFFSNVSHEFRTPLTLMLGPLEQTLADPGHSLQAHRADLEVAHRNALRLLRLVNSLLDFSRLEAARIQASFQPTDLAALTNNLASVFRSAIEQAGLAFEVECDVLPAAVWVDWDMWEKIVLNLLSNAFKYTHRGTIRLELRAADEAVRLRVADTGIGIAADAVPHLLERFYRVPGARGRTHEGTGIGLSLVNELVKQHGGSIDIESTPGTGSAFTVTIPGGSDHLPPERVLPEARRTWSDFTARTYVEESRRWERREATAAAPLGPHARSQADAADSRPAVLLADDNADMREYVAGLLQPRFRVRGVRDGQEALEALSQEMPELVLTDVMMPRLDGLGLLRAIRADPRWRELPVVMLSARAGEEATIEGLDAAADDYIVKPFAARELMARIDGQIAMRRLRAAAQAAVKASERRFRDALASSMVGFGVMHAVRDAHGAVVDFEWRYVNPTAEQLLKRPAQELIGQRVRDVLPQNWHGSRWFDAMVRAATTGEAADIEVPVPVPGATTLWFHNSIARTEEGLVVWFSDITQRKQAETELREVDRRKDEFLAILAHELRNPLAPIRQAAAIASAARASEAQLRWSHGVIERQVRHMARLLDDLLDVSRITRGTLELRRESLELQAVVDAAIETARPCLDGKGHRLVVRIAGDLPRLNADGLRIAQVLANLLTNAAKYTDPGGRIELTAEHAAGDVVIEVADTGIGIAADSLPKIFHMFSQLRPALERSEGGLGIGLALVKGLIALHGGSVEAHSAGVGQGSQFVLRLPVASPGNLPTPGTLRAAPAPAPITRRKILVVDDNADAAESLATLLALDGHQVRTAGDAEQATLIAREFRPELAVLDIGLPRRNGYELAQDLRKHCVPPPVLVAVTGWGQEEDRQRARAAGFDEHLTKPVDPEALRRLTQALGTRHA
jgi:signal transduction histidine kinase